MPYISPHGAGWLVRVPYAYDHTKLLKYKKKRFSFSNYASSDKALTKAIEFRDANLMKGLEYNYRGATASNGRQVRGERIRGHDLPVGITDTVQLSRQGKEQHSITVQASCDNIRRTRSFMYGHSRTRREAIVEAKETLAVFLGQIEDSF